MLVEVSPMDALQKSIEIVDVKGKPYAQAVVFEWLPKICRECVRFGHDSHNCEVLKQKERDCTANKMVWVLKVRAESNAAEDNSSMHGPCPVAPHDAVNVASCPDIGCSVDANLKINESTVKESNEEIKGKTVRNTTSLEADEVRSPAEESTDLSNGLNIRSAEKDGALSAEKESWSTYKRRNRTGKSAAKANNNRTNDNFLEVSRFSLLADESEEDVVVCLAEQSISQMNKCESSTHKEKCNG